MGLKTRWGERHLFISTANRYIQSMFGKRRMCMIIKDIGKVLYKDIWNLKLIQTQEKFRPDKVTKLFEAHFHGML